MQTWNNWIIFQIPHKFIAFEMRVDLISVGFCEDSESLLDIILPFSLVLATISVVEYTFTMSLSVFPLAFVSVSQLFLLALAFQPDVTSETVLQISFPSTSVFLTIIQPFHRPLST